MAGVFKKIFKDEERTEKPMRQKTARQGTSEARKQPQEKRLLPEAYKTVLHPLITEKATALAAGGKYSFVVDKSANKTAVGKIIAALYGVVPQKINFTKFGGKSVRYGRHFGVKKIYKKAIVSLKPGEKIEVYEGV